MNLKSIFLGVFISLLLFMGFTKTAVSFVWFLLTIMVLVSILLIYFYYNAQKLKVTKFNYTISRSEIIPYIELVIFAFIGGVCVERGYIITGYFLWFMLLWTVAVTRPLALKLKEKYSAKDQIS